MNILGWTLLSAEEHKLLQFNRSYVEMLVKELETPIPDPTWKRELITNLRYNLLKLEELKKKT